MTVVLGRDEIVQNRPVGDLAGQLHHLHSRGTDVDRHVFGSSLLVDIVEFDAIEMHEVAVHRHRLVVEQGTNGLNDLPHHPDRLTAIDADLRRQRIPPSPQAADDTARRQVVECGEHRGKAGGVAGPDVDDAGTDLDRVSCCPKRRHRHACLTHKAGVGLPHRLETLLLGVLGIRNRVPNRVGILKVQRSSCHRRHSAPSKPDAPTIASRASRKATVSRGPDRQSCA